MSMHNPIGSCCSRPRFNVIGGIDDRAWTCKLMDNSLVNGARKVDRTAAFIVAGILAALAVVYAGALILFAD
jgi:hypothetical protein